MPNAKTMQSFLVMMFMTLIFLFIAGCEGNTGASNGKISFSPPVRDVRIIISAYQEQLLKPAGVPLTAEQEKKITEAFNPDSPTDMRPVIGVFTKEQKQALVNDIRKKLGKTWHSLTKSQAARIMAIGPGGKDKSVQEIFTEKQSRILLSRLKR